MLAQIDTGTAMIVAAVIAAIPATLALWNRRSLAQINRAVNHVGEGEPTLIERVRGIESSQKEFHDWSISSMKILAKQVGTELPELGKE